MTGIVAGVDGYAVCISSATTGAAGSESPDYTGDEEAIFLFAEKIQIMNKSKDKKSLIPNNKGIKILTGKADINMKISGCNVGPQGASTGTTQIELIEDFVYRHGRKRGGAKVFLFVKNLADDDWKKLDHNDAHVHIKPLEGYIADTDVEFGKGNVYKLNSLIFEQVR